MVEGKMYLRKSVTAYTVQHEMFHMKLWYKMTKEFPELESLFQKTLGVENRLFHEEYVLAEFMKNPSKWKEASENIFEKSGNKYRGTSKEGFEVEFFSIDGKIIENSYPYTKNL